MDKIDRMRAFAFVAKEGSFTGAGRRLGKSTRLVSKYVADLEASLGVQLLNRTTRSVALTDVGATYLAMCEPLLDGLDELEDVARTAHRSLKGVIRISAPTGFGSLRLAPSLAAFAAVHPEVEIDLRLSDRRVDLVEEGFDLAIRIGPLRDSALRLRRLGPMPLVVCASAAYLARAGTPERPADLAAHECVLDVGAGEPAVWRFEMDGEELDVRVAGRLRADAPAAAARFAIEGAAIARCPAYTVSEALETGRLTELFRANRVEPFSVAALYPPIRRVTTRLRALLDHLAADRALCGVWE